MLLGLGWIAYLLCSAVDGTVDLRPEGVLALVVASTALTLSMFLPSMIFWILLNNDSGERVAYADTHELYFSGQLLRYLPGRIWGIAYQISRTTRRLSAVRLTRVNVELMLYVMGMNVVLSMLILGVRLGWPTNLTLFAFFAGLIALSAFFMGGFRGMIRGSTRLLPKRLASALDTASERPWEISTLLLVSVIFVGGKAVYLLAWNLLSRAYPMFEGVDMTSLAMMYSIAAIVGIASVVTPAGLGVREVSFVVLGSVVAGKGELAFLAVFVRLWLLAAELLLSLLSAITITWRHRHDETTTV